MRQKIQQHWKSNLDAPSFAICAGDTLTLENLRKPKPGELILLGIWDAEEYLHIGEYQGPAGNGWRFLMEDGEVRDFRPEQIRLKGRVVYVDAFAGITEIDFAVAA
ncbi:MAG TPA: hypothetical protein VFD58_10805 [Blastocatellia bacterium]|nr:hypothetical protein [Blastocatellia bacterium]